MAQVLGAACGIDPAIAKDTVLLTWPKLPGKIPQPGKFRQIEDSVAGIIQNGYGLTKNGASDPAVRDAALKFLQFFYSNNIPEKINKFTACRTTIPILRKYQIPEDAEILKITKQTLSFVRTHNIITDVIDILPVWGGRTFKVYPYWQAGEGFCC